METIKTKTLATIDSTLLADFILSKIDPASHLKIQKMLYYVSGFHLAYFNQDLISDDFEAWVHGPVSKRLYRSLKAISILHSDMKFNGDKNNINSKVQGILTSDQYDLIMEVINVYGKYTGLELESLTHSEKPWIEARIGYGSGDKCEVKIKKNLIKELFNEKLNG